jgi:hypothetical protein
MILKSARREAVMSFPTPPNEMIPNPMKGASPSRPCPL